MSEKEKKTKRPLKGRVFQCTGFPNCNKSFTRLEHLARHRRKHTGERPFTCPHCSKNFSRLDNLRQHKQTVHAYENYIKKRSTSSVRENDAQEPIPGTPLQFPPKLFSPPELGSPQYSLAYYSYYDKTSAPPALPPLHLLVEPNKDDEQVLRAPPKFNPKNRPRPLALLHTFADDNAIDTRSTAPAIMVEPPLKTAPAMSLFPVYSSSYGVPRFGRAEGQGFAYGIGSRLSATPMLLHFSSLMVSPLLPLFHQLFNQVASSTLYTLNPTSIRSSGLAPALSILLQSQGSASDNTGSAKPEPKPERNEDDKKVWLKKMLNDEPKKLAIGSLITPGEEGEEPADNIKAEDPTL